MVHKTVTKMITGQVERVGFVQTDEERVQGDLVVSFQYLQGILRKMRTDSLVTCCDRIGGKCFKVKESRCRTEVRMIFLIMMLVKH